MKDLGRRAIMGSRNRIFVYLWNLTRNAAQTKALWRGLLVLAALVAAGLVPPQSADAASFKLLHGFCAKANCADGKAPYAGLIMDSAGNIFGTASSGGAHNGGVVFELVPNAGKTNYAEKVLYSFCAKAKCADGQTPDAGLTVDSSGDLFGTTFAGGANCQSGDPIGCGTVFKLTRPAAGQTKWTEKVLYSFCAAANCADGSFPHAVLVMDGAGNLFGTTFNGGVNCQSAIVPGCGTVFEMVLNKATGKYAEKVLYKFCSELDCADGQYPTGTLAMDVSGDLYGAASNGGANNAGVAFKLVANGAKTHWTEKVIHDFCAKAKCADGQYPYGGLIMDGSGKLFGTTIIGGANGAGTAFELTPNAAGSKFTEKVLYSFCAKADCVDGVGPQAGLMMDGAGNLFGTTSSGGAHSNSGTAFKLVPNADKTKYTENVVHSFCAMANCADGAIPLSSLIADGSGNLFGTTSGGGAFNGSVFKLVSP
jgi:uncharacterized repeat protein (TIGR03803 family)